MTNLLLYITTVAIWGTSWLGVKFQLGLVAPEVSVAYRFFLAGILMLAICLIGRYRLKFSIRDHIWIAQQGFFLFSANYCLIYLGTQYLTSGLVAVVFSMVVILNLIGSALVFKSPVEPRVVIGAIIGLAGITTIFWPEIAAFDLAREGSLGLVLCLVGTAFASCGMLTSAANQKRGIPVMATNGWGMLYGSIVMMLFAGLNGSEFNFDTSPTYIWSLIYLAVFASVIAFWSYLTLLGNIGPGRASYATVLFPIVALALSTWFEGFQWTTPAIAGVALVIVGNVFVLLKPATALGKPTASETT